MAARKPMFMSAEGWQEEMATSDSMTLGGLTMGGNVVMGGNKLTGLGAASGAGEALAYGQSSASLAGLTSTDDIALGGNEVTGLPATPTGGTAATSKAYVDQLVITGGSIKEAILHNEQLDNAEGILAAGVLTFQTNPISGDLVTLTDGVTTRAYGAGAGGDVQYTIGATVVDSMTNLAAAINGDGTSVWAAEFNTEHPDIDSDGSIIIWEEDNDAGATKMYGVWGTQADIEEVDFYNELDYTKTALTEFPATAPTNSQFGFRRTQASLTDGEMHYSLNNDVMYGWDNDTSAWNVMSGSASIPDATSASGGGTKGKLTMDSDKGLVLVGGIAEVNIDAVTLDFDASTKKLEVTGIPSLFEIAGTPVGATVDAAALDTLTDGSNADGEHIHDYSASGHSHAHGDLTGVTSDQHHAQSHTIASHSDTTATGPELDNLTDGTNADSLHSHASATATEAPKVENTIDVGEAILAGQPVYWTSTNDQIGKGDAGVDAKSRIMGVARTAQAVVGQTSEVVSLGECTGVLSGATAGVPYYLQDTGGIGISLPGGGKRVIMVGYARNADDLWVEIHDYGKKAA